MSFATIPELLDELRAGRMVVIVVTFQLVVIAAGTFFFTAMGFANEPAGSCGGG